MTTGEPDALKGASPVRRGAEGKVLRIIGATRRQPTLHCYASNFTKSEQDKRNWGQWVRVKENAAKQAWGIRRGELASKTVYMATATDPYQPVERIAGVTREILAALAERQHGVKLVIQTRGTLVVRDIDLMQQIEREGGRVQVNMTITTDDDEVRKIYEPGCSGVNARVRAIAKVQEAGIQSCVTMTPALPMRDGGEFIRRMTGLGIRRFIAQPFHHPDKERGDMIAQTDQRAIASAVKHYEAEDPGEAIRRYNADYIRVIREIRRAADEAGNCVLGEGREGFSPPF